MDQTTLLPKAELHVHLEGTLSPAMVVQLAKRNNMKLPDGIFNEKGEYNWNNFPEFLNSYDTASSVIRTHQDYVDVTYGYLASIAHCGAIYAELAIAPDIPLMFGMDYGSYMAALEEGVHKAREEFGIEARFIVTIVRHMGPDTGLRLMQMVAKKPHTLIAGVGLAGNERAYAPRNFAESFAIAKDMGLGCTAHAGEVSGPESVWATIDELPVTRIGHGVRSIEDPLLLKELAARSITLEVCPNSNIALHVYPDMAAHPLRKLYEAGVVGSLNSDDPPFFWTNLQKEYDTAAQHFGFTEMELRGLTRRAVEVSFADKKTKQAILARIAG